MNKYIMFSLAFVLLVGFMNVVSAEDCSLNISLLNQDPYPAVQGEYVKLVLSVEGLSNPNCGEVYIELEDKFPISFDRGATNRVVLKSGAYVSDYKDYALVPFKVKVDENALNDEYELTVRYAPNYISGTKTFLTKKIALNVEDSNTVFEVSVKDYDYVKKTLTFEIINVGKQDVNALTVDISNQETFAPKGSTRTIVGSLDSNDDTSFSFTGVPATGDINIKISYNDPQGVRRYLQEKTYFDESLFIDKLTALEKPNYTIYFVLIMIVVIVVFVIRSSIKKKRKLEQMKARKI